MSIDGECIKRTYFFVKDYLHLYTNYASCNMPIYPVAFVDSYMD